MTPIVLIGGGGHCASCIDVIEWSDLFKVAGIIDNQNSSNKDLNIKYPIIGRDEDLPKIVMEYPNYLITIGHIKDAKVRMNCFLRIKHLGGHFPVIVSSRAYISKHSSVSEGTIVMHDALLNANSSIGFNTIINSKALIEHDSHVGSNCHVSTGAIINGKVIVEDNCFLGSGSIIHHGVRIGHGSIISAGKVVKENIPPHSIVRA